MRSDGRDVYKRVTAGNVLKIEEQRIDNRKRNKSEIKIGTIRNEKRIIKQRSPKQRTKRIGSKIIKNRIVKIVRKEKNKIKFQKQRTKSIGRML